MIEKTPKTGVLWQINTQKKELISSLSGPTLEKIKTGLLNGNIITQFYCATYYETEEHIIIETPFVCDILIHPTRKIEFLYRNELDSFTIEKKGLGIQETSLPKWAGISKVEATKLMTQETEFYAIGTHPQELIKEQ